MIPTATTPAKFPTIIVVGNEKGGSGKSTIAMHIAVALMNAGQSVGAIDLDARQRSFTRYIENRRAWAQRTGCGLAVPPHVCIEGRADIADAGARHRHRQLLTDAIADLAESCGVILIDTPGHDTFLSRVAHSLAHTLITPLNDSFLDLDVLASVDPETFAIDKVSHYAAMVEEARLRRQLVGEAGLSWVVLRNRLSTLGMSRNKRLVATRLQELSHRLNFRFIDGLAERVIFREFFPRGLTALDNLEERTLGTRPTVSHATARLEIEELFGAVLLSKLAPRRRDQVNVA
jgi:chromosome partitioning protein